MSVDSLLDKVIKTPSGELASEVELIRFFVMFTKLRLVDSETVYAAYEKLITKLVAN